jgi:hypothetical protein
MAFDQNHSVFAGMSQPALQAALAQAQTALIALQSGQQVANISYGEGGGMKHVTYRVPEMGSLVQLIGELKACLGLSDRARRGMRISF